MVIIRRKKDGIVYLYGVASQKQLYLGREDDPDSINLKHLKETIAKSEKTFDKFLDRHVRDVQEYADLLGEPYGSTYSKKREKDIRRRIRHMTK